MYNGIPKFVFGYTNCGYLIKLTKSLRAYLFWDERNYHNPRLDGQDRLTLFYYWSRYLSNQKACAYFHQTFVHKNESMGCWK